MLNRAPTAKNWVFFRMFRAKPLGRGIGATEQFLQPLSDGMQQDDPVSWSRLKWTSAAFIQLS